MREGIRKVYPVKASSWHFDVAMERGCEGSRGWKALASHSEHDLNVRSVDENRPLHHCIQSIRITFLCVVKSSI